jgi:hypothetical protein
LGHELALQTHVPALQVWPSPQVAQAPPFFPHAVTDGVVMQPPF